MEVFKIVSLGVALASLGAIVYFNMNNNTETVFISGGGSNGVTSNAYLPSSTPKKTSEPSARVEEFNTFREQNNTLSATSSSGGSSKTERTQTAVSSLQKKTDLANYATGRTPFESTSNALQTRTDAVKKTTDRFLSGGYNTSFTSFVSSRSGGLL